MTSTSNTEGAALDWSSFRTVVLGGGGFLGGHLVADLKQRGAQVIVPRTADGNDFRSLDNVVEFFREHRPQIVFNCAARQGGLAYQRQCPAEIFYDNMLLGLNSMHAAHLCDVNKYVNVVAGCSYPGYLDGIMSEEDYWSGPLHESVINYGFTKKSQVVQGWCYERQYGFKSIHLLMTNLFGPGEHFHPDRSHGLAALLRKTYEANRDNAPQITVWGTGKPVREWLYVKDAVEAMILAAERCEDVEPLNVSLGGGLTISELVEVIKDVVGYEGQIIYDTSKPDGALQKSFSNARIRDEIGWTPRTPIEEGIRETLLWFESNYEYATAER